MIHDAHVGRLVIVHYRFHPLYAQTIRVQYNEETEHKDFVFVELPDGSIGGIPRWMTDRVVCSAMTLGSPRLAIPALVELKKLVDIVLKTTSDVREDAHQAGVDRGTHGQAATPTGISARASVAARLCAHEGRDGGAAGDIGGPSSVGRKARADGRNGEEDQ